MKMLKMSLAMLAMATFFACGEPAKTEEVAAEEVVVAPEAPAVPATVVDIAVGSPDHSTLVAALTAAGLVETLSGPGPFTVFAPTDAAFKALPPGTLDDLLKPENKGKLASILTYHVLPGNVMDTDLTDGMKSKTVNGSDLSVSIKEGKVMVDGANVTTASIKAGNGVVHVIDAVILPK